MIMDEYGNVNVVMPQQLTDLVLTMGGSLEEVLNKLDNVLLPPEVYEHCQQLADTIEQLKKDYNVYSITLNDAFPSEVGVYKFTVLGYKDTEHGVVVTKSVLTITCAHEYTNDCDTDCNLCGEPRNVGDHIYDNACDADCNVCGAVRDTEEHVYTNNCDVDCDVCGATREPSEHVYDNACDNTCNECNAEREVEDHQYVGVETTLPTCGTAGVKTYTCSICGHEYTEEIPATGEHTYDNACDAECNGCNEPRTPDEHVYDDEYDPDCNICGTIREVPTKCEHAYDNNCDNTCNLCGEAREVGEHMYDDEYDADCNECGALRDVPTKPAPEEPVPGTSDISIGLVTSLMTISCVALVVLMLSKKQFLYTGKYSK